MMTEGNEMLKMDEEGNKSSEKRFTLRVFPFVFAAFCMVAIFAFVGYINNEFETNRKAAIDEQGFKMANLNAVLVQTMATQYATDDDPSTSPQDAAKEANDDNAIKVSEQGGNISPFPEVHTQVVELNDGTYCAVSNYGENMSKSVVYGADTIESCLG